MKPVFPIDRGAFGIDAGLTKRELISTMAMQAIVSDREVSRSICNNDPRYNGSNFAETVAINSVEFADALLKELEK